MSPWLGADNKVERFYRPHKKVISRRHAPSGFAWQEDLYRIEIPNAKNPVEVEYRLSQIENAGLIVRDKILAFGVNALSQEERAQFSLFIATLLVRRPEMVRPKIVPAQEDIQKRIVEALKVPIEMGKIDEEKLLEMTMGLGSGLVMQAMFDSARKFAAEIFSLEWRSFDLKVGGLPAVLADYPFKMWGENDKRLKKITIPLGPYCAFVGGRAQSWTEVAYQDEFRQILALEFIGDQFRAARHFVVGISTEKNDAYLQIANDNWGRDHQQSL